MELKHNDEHKNRDLQIQTVELQQTYHKPQDRQLQTVSIDFNQSIESLQ